MKKNLLPILCLSILMIVSCGDDEDATIEVNNSISYGSQSYEVNYGFVIDEGYDEEIDLSSALFALSDNPVSINNNGNFSASGAYLLAFAVTSIGSQSLRSSTYTFNDGISAPSSNDYYNSGQIIINGRRVLANSGTIQIQVNAPSYTISFNLEMDNGETLTGGFSGEFASE